MPVQHPQPAYHFLVEWGGSRTGFSEVSGLEITHEVIEYREGGSPVNSVIKQPGMTKYSNIILKRGVIANDMELYQWMQSVAAQSPNRRDVVIELLDRSHQPIMSWIARNAWPCKFSVSDLNASGNEVVVESVELAHEGLEVLT